MPDLNFSEKIILENNFTKLSPLEIEDVPNLLPVILRNNNLLKYSSQPVNSEEGLTEYIKTGLADKKKQSQYAFIIFDKRKNEFAGSTRFANISNKDKRLEIGWTWIGQKFQGTGLNKNNKFLMLQYAFEILGFERVELKTDARNLQSRRAMEKIGAKYEGLLRSYTLMSDGYRRDTVYYSILKNEWQGVKENIFNGF